MKDRPLRAVDPSDVPDAVVKAEALVHLLACLKGAIKLLDECGEDIDARVVEAHAAQLAAGREWPGEPIETPFLEAGEGDLKEPWAQVLAKRKRGA